MKITPRQTTSSWASPIAILAVMFAAFDGSHAFSPSSLTSSSRSKMQSVKTTTVSPINDQWRKIHPSSTSTSTTSLQALPHPKAAFATITTIAAFTPPITSIALYLSALTETIIGGIFAGSLHAIAGPDHLAALIPRCCGLPWYRAARVGAVWGLGHGVSATLLGMAGFMFKKGVRLSGVFANAGGGNFDLLHHAGSFMELAIGASLIVIGLLGIKEAREWEAPEEGACEVATAAVDDDAPKSLSAAATPEASLNPINPAKRHILFNGILHGFSWDGAPSLAPAVAIATWRGSLTFLLSYALGTMAAMSLATTLIGEGTRRAAGKLERPDLPRDLSVASSFLALVVGVVWCGFALR
ncbi:hypothetical protein ACHAXR_003710 [Thalassiosira sp. AJA248-18]